MKVTGEGRMKESITRRRQAPSIATIGSTCDLNLKIPGVTRKSWGGALGRARGLRLTSAAVSPRELVPDGVCPGAPDAHLHA